MKNIFPLILCLLGFVGLETTSVSAQVVITSVTETPCTCNGSSTGRLTVIANGGTKPYQFSRNGGATYQTSNQFTNLPRGEYTILVRDAAGLLSDPFAASVSQPPKIQGSRVITQVSCFGAKDGRVVITASGGVPPYQYSINNGATYQTSNEFNNLAASNSYFIRIRDSKNCVFGPMGASVGQPARATVTVTGTDPLCHKGTDGTITITAVGGHHSWNYSLDGGKTYQESNVFTGLSAGTYAVTVKDIVGDCPLLTEEYTLKEPPALELALETHSNGNFDIPCPGRKNGSLYAYPSNGVEPYQYAWSNGRGTEAIYQLDAGTYSVTVTDAHGCKIDGSKTLTVGPELVVTLPQCQSILLGYGDQCRTLTPTFSGTDTSPYVYRWSTGARTPSVSVCPTATSNFSVTVSNNNDCNVIVTTQVQVTDVRCGPTKENLTMCNRTGSSSQCVPKSQVETMLAQGWKVQPCHYTPCDGGGSPGMTMSGGSNELAAAPASSIQDENQGSQSGTETRPAKRKDQIRDPNLGEAPLPVSDTESRTAGTKPRPKATSSLDGTVVTMIGDSGPGLSGTGSSASTGGTTATKTTTPAPSPSKMMRSTEGITATYDAASRAVLVKVDCPDCKPYQSLKMDVRDAGTGALLYTGPVTIVQGKGEARVPVYGTFNNGVNVTATGAAKTLQATISGKAMR